MCVCVCVCVCVQANHLQKQWTGIVAADASISQWDTGVDVGLLKYVGSKSVTLPKDFVSQEGTIGLNNSKY